jgi:hypothetical protein
VVSANRAQLAFVAAVLFVPLIPISNRESQVGHEDEVVPLASRLPSALKSRVAGCPEPGEGVVPLAEGASKLPEGLLCLKMILTALTPEATDSVGVAVGELALAVKLRGALRIHPCSALSAANMSN